MTEKEVIEHLNSRIKPYQDLMHQGTYSNSMIRYKLGLLKPATICTFFIRLGYKMKDGSWIAPIEKELKIKRA